MFMPDDKVQIRNKLEIQECFRGKFATVVNVLFGGRIICVKLANVDWPVQFLKEDLERIED